VSLAWFRTKSVRSTRRRIARALAMLKNKHVEMPARKHDNLPL
jgi:propionyl-CoA carboxylase beta chain